MLEVLIASAILAMVALMIFTAFTHTSSLRQRLSARQERDHLARLALMKFARDVRSAFLSAHVNTNPTHLAVVTAFVGVDGSPGDRVDMTTFSHRRFARNAHEGDAAEVGYRLEARRGNGTGYDLVRRESARIDNEPLRGGVVDLLVPNVSSFQIRYYDLQTEQWTDTWDTQQLTAQAGRLPARVRVTLTVRDPSDGREYTYMTETQPMISDVLRFGLPIDYAR